MLLACALRAHASRDSPPVLRETPECTCHEAEGMQQACKYDGQLKRRPEAAQSALLRQPPLEPTRAMVGGQREDLLSGDARLRHLPNATAV